MYLILMLIAVAALFTILIITAKIFNCTSLGIRATIFICFILIFALLAFCMSEKIRGSMEASDLKAEYAELTLYYPAVMESNDEYIRYDFYTRTVEFNEKLNQNITHSESKWFDVFYPKNWSDGLNEINLHLNGIEY